MSSTTNWQVPAKRAHASPALHNARGLMRVAIAALLATVMMTAPLMAESPTDRFIASLDGDSSIPKEAVRLIRAAWQECDDCDPAEFLTQGLAVMSDPFRAMLDQFDADDYKKCAASAGALRSSPNPFIATHAALYEIKSLVELERVQEARHRIDELLLDGGDDVYSFTYAGAEIAFLHGYALLGDLQYGAATVSLRNFLRDYPNASQRLRIGAEQMLAELATRQSGQIGEVVDLMDYSRRRLAGAESSPKVQERQARIIELLDTLIQDAEQQEKASSSSSSGGGGKGSGKQRKPSKPMEQSRLPGGAPGSGDATRSARRANPAEAWGAMPPAQRERILQALRDSFPKRYRKLVEQYYEELAKKP